MAKKPSERRNYEDEDMELNLTPMMNLISLLIPCLLSRWYLSKLRPLT